MLFIFIFRTPVGRNFLSIWCIDAEVYGASHICERRTPIYVNICEALNCYLSDLILESTDSEIISISFSFFIAKTLDAHFGHAILYDWYERSTTSYAGCCVLKIVLSFWNI